MSEKELLYQLQREVREQREDLRTQLQTQELQWDHGYNDLV